ncbi:hypothetical protein A6R68_07536, partial [Neotoma lepida]
NKQDKILHNNSKEQRKNREKEEGKQRREKEGRSWTERRKIFSGCFDRNVFPAQAIGCVKMKLNISFPATSCQKLIQLEDEHKLCMFYEKHMATEVAADALGEEWKGYVVRISGRNDKQHFPRKQGILTHSSV